MKTLAIALITLITSSAAFAHDVDNNPPTPATVSAWQAEQQAIRDEFAKLPAAEQQRIQKINAYWDAQSLRENQRTH
ncbi:hypothetical protein DLM_0162 [Aquitalea magnusonii]|jgi:hypothetical protein|uniref:Uncharacterized protein n=1 Tax=Aquitalea magnusonii TaxID=332411 RepID=A0A3G9G8E1_9NEIS|nr:hypothetical protein [Aquitalea magnusonii]BBF83845.1 hypothetical protein DLM_0162 [Aquitalea magnusonii]